MDLIDSAAPTAVPAAIPALPSRHQWLVGARWATWVGLVFFGLYPALNGLTARRAMRWRLYLDVELALPFVPELVWAYLSMYLLFVLPPFFLSVAQLAMLGRQLIAGTLLGALGFLLLPAELGFLRSMPAQPPYDALFGLIFSLDAPHNLVPSLHVVFSAAIVLACAEVAPPAWRRALQGWLALIALSTVLVHQHHLLDVVAALLLVAVLRARWPLRVADAV
ncbi:MAG: hypothetical protein RLY71_1871 [Pseudomonadota bacterium]